MLILVEFAWCDRCCSPAAARVAMKTSVELEKCMVVQPCGVNSVIVQGK